MPNHKPEGVPRDEKAQLLQERRLLLMQLGRNEKQLRALGWVPKSHRRPTP